MITIEDVITLWRPLQAEEVDRAKALISIILSDLKTKAKAADKDLEELAKDEDYLNVLKSVVVDVVARTLMTSTNSEPMTQTSESALGYSWSGSYLVPGGGLFIKKSELARLGLNKQRYGVMDFYGTNQGNNGYFNR